MLTNIGTDNRISPTGKAILEFITVFKEENCENCTYADLETEFGGRVWSEIHTLIAARKVFVAVPLSLLDYDTAILPVTWAVGESCVEDIRREFGEPPAAAISDQGAVFTYDLYFEIVEDHYPLPPAPYASREAEDEERPDDCAFFYTNVWPPEALQAEFEFDAAGTLVSDCFKIGTRCPSS